MPIYEYECSACKFYVEVLQKISEGPLKKCPSCKKPTMKRLISAPVFRLKGAGWYETDFKSENEEKRNLAEREEPAEAKADDKKEAKPEEKEAKPAEVKPVDKSEGRKLAAKKGPQGKPAAKAVAKPTPKASKSKPVAKAPAKKKKKAARRR